MSPDSAMKAASARAETRVRVYLHAGQVFATKTPCEITTILGSCVGVVLVDEAQCIGGASHYLLPFDGGGQQTSPRFGNVAIAELVANMLALGCRKADLVAKVFGGASMRGQGHVQGPSLGDKNVDIARQKLQRDGIPIVAEDVGGSSGRKLVILTDRGQVWVKKL